MQLHNLLGITTLVAFVSAGVLPQTATKHATATNDGYDRQHMDYRASNNLYQPKSADELETSYWMDAAQKFVHEQTTKKWNTKRAKNIILFLGDGMSPTTLAATRMYMGSEQTRLSFEDFPNLGMSKTYCVDYQVADSACTSTAYLSGVKANYGTIGVTAAVPRGDCTKGMDQEHRTSSIAAWAMAAGKAAGLVTTTRVTHASPAGVYAHAADREWEHNELIKESGCSDLLVDDIAKQLIEGDVGKRLKVVMGGGRREFLNTTVRDNENKRGKRTDGRNLIEEWLAAKQMESDRKSFVWNKTELMGVDAAQTDYLLGLFEHSHLRFHLDVVDEKIDDLEPTLSEMVDKAIDVLAKSEEGFFLFVEGGLIDRGHHAGQAHYALDETVEFARAIDLARRKLNDEDTLIVTTADHGHTLSYAGYNDRGNDIRGVSGERGKDGIPYFTLGYANGPGFPNNHNQTANRANGGLDRIDPLTLDYSDKNFAYPGTLPLSSETHSGDDVVVYATGPWSHLFQGVFEENAIPHMMAYAACVGKAATLCKH